MLGSGCQEIWSNSSKEKKIFPILIRNDLVALKKQLIRNYYFYNFAWSFFSVGIINHFCDQVTSWTLANSPSNLWKMNWNRALHFPRTTTSRQVVSPMLSHSPLLASFFCVSALFYGQFFGWLTRLSVTHIHRIFLATSTAKNVSSKLLWRL